MLWGARSTALRISTYNNSQVAKSSHKKRQSASPGRARGVVPTLMPSDLPELSLDEAGSPSPGARTDFIGECRDRLLRKDSKLFGMENHAIVLYRYHHGRKSVTCPVEDMLILLEEITEALWFYALAERHWNRHDEGEHYRCLKDAANCIHPASPTFYQYDRPLRPQRKDQDLRRLADTLRTLAEHNKVKWTPPRRWEAFLNARRELVAKLWPAFDVLTRPRSQGFPGLLQSGRKTAIYKWIGKILEIFSIGTSDQDWEKLWRILRQDREQREAYSPHFKSLEQATRHRLDATITARRERTRALVRTFLSAPPR